MTTQYSRFTTELRVRPDDIDMNQHVHNSRYFDYVLAARYEQMERDYRMPMEEFIALGFGWVVRAAQIDFKRPLLLNDTAVITTWVKGIVKDGVSVGFEIVKQKTGKLSATGTFDYTMVSLATGRGERIPDWIVAKYSI